MIASPSQATQILLPSVLDALANYTIIATFGPSNEKSI